MKRLSSNSVLISVFPPMLWLASYPRSGNTFFRNVLFEAYGLQSSTFHDETDYPVDPEYTNYPIVKTHLLPSQLDPADPTIPAVYLVRDGRDCVVSLAHYRKQLLDSDSDFRLNVQAAIEAAGGSHFGGWGHHVRSWSERADLILHFEELISDPIACLERLRPWIDLPQPKLDKVPTFSDLKSRDFQYGSGREHGFAPEDRKRWREGKFRRGKVAGWKDELPHDLHMRFLHHHSDALERTGYITVPESLLPPEEQFDSNPKSHWFSKISLRKSPPARILIDGVKLLDTQIDGVWRYVRELVTAIHDQADEKNRWEIDVSLGCLGNYPIAAVVNDFLLESLPETEIHPLFHHGQINPIVQSQQRIERLKKAGRNGVLAERLRLKFHRLHRSCLKRYGAIKKFIQPSEQAYDLCHLTLPNTWQHYQHVESPFLTTVHDLSNLICPELQNPSNVRTLADGLQFAGKRDSDYLSVSLATKQQMIELLRIPDERIRVVHNAVTQDKFSPVYEPGRLQAIRQRYDLPDEPFFLCLGTIEPRKNLVNTIRAFRMLREEHPDLPVQLILAGGTGWQKLDELRRIIDSESRIRYIGYVDDSDLAALYSSAQALCYASLYEGFGLPLLESMACGTPVIYGDNSSMPEFASDCGLPVVSDDPHSIKQAFHRLGTDRALHNQLSSNAYARGQSLTWQKTAQHTLSLYQNLIENHRANSRYSKRKKVA